MASKEELEKLNGADMLIVALLHHKEQAERDGDAVKLLGIEKILDKLRELKERSNYYY